MADRLDYAWEALEHYGVDPDEYDDTSPELQEDSEECPMCGGPLITLGSLGSRDYWRCRNCGFDYGVG